MITEEIIRNNEQIRTYITKADEALVALGYTEHSFAHVTKVARFAKQLMLDLGYGGRKAELAWIAGYLHDIGNVINRIDHAQSGAIMAFWLLNNLGADAEELSMIISAIGNHDESTAFPVNEVAAALILADKTDVRRSRVRNADFSTFDIHDRVNYAVVDSSTRLSEDKKAILLSVTIDTEISPVMDYFEIFLDRMLLCRKAAEKLGLKFQLDINGQSIL